MGVATTTTGIDDTGVDWLSIMLFVRHVSTTTLSTLLDILVAEKVAYSGHGFVCRGLKHVYWFHVNPISFQPSMGLSTIFLYSSRGKVVDMDTEYALDTTDSEPDLPGAHILQIVPFQTTIVWPASPPFLDRVALLAAPSVSLTIRLDSDAWSASYGT